MKKETQTYFHSVAKISSHRHFSRAMRWFHIGSVGISVWAVGMVWIAASSFLGQPASAEGGATVAGHITAAGTAVPLGKVQVQIMTMGQPPSGPPAQTDSSGNFLLSNVTPGGGYTLQVQIVDSTFPYIGKMIKDVTVAAGANNVGDIALTSAPKTLTVTVTRNSTGAGVGSVQVGAFKMGGDFTNTNGTTNSSGVAVLHMSGGNWGMNLQGGFDQYGHPVSVDWVYVGQQIQVSFASDDSAESQSLTLTVQNATATVKGTLKYPDGTAASRLGLNLRNSSNAMINGNTDESGNFSIKVVAGNYEFSCFLPPEKGQYSCPSSSFSVSDNETKDFGTVTLGQKSAKITGTVTCNGEPVRNVNISAFPMSANKEGTGGGPGPGGQSFTQSGADGTYSLFVNAGTVGVNAFAQPDSGCVAAGGPPTSVTVADNQTVSGVNFSLIKADVIINGMIKDANGAAVTNFFGFANAMDASGSFGPGKQFGGPVQNGSFQIRLPSSAMTKATINVFPPPQGAQYSVKAPVTLSIAANQTYAVVLVVAPNDATLSGSVKDSKGNALPTAEGDAFISNETNTEFHNTRISGGHYSFSLLGGKKWHLGYHIQGNFQDSPPSPDLISVAAGEAVTKDIVVTTADATINVTVKDPDGNLVPQAFAMAHQPFNQTLSTKEPPRGSGGPVQNGVAVIHVVGGFTYMVGAGLPPEFSDKNYMPPEEKTVKPAANGSASVTVQFRKADGSLKGTATLSTGGNANFGFVGCWSDKGSNTGGPINNGSFSVSLTKSDTWHCHGNSNKDNSVFYDSGEFTVTTENTTNFTLTQNITLNKSTFTLPQPVSETVDATQQKIVTLSDGTTITVPAGAFGTSGSFTLTATPTVNLTPSISAKPALGFGYTLGVTNSSGTAVTTFSSAVTISFPYNTAAVAKLGIEPTDLVPKYFDSTTNTWQDVSSVTVNSATSTITFTTDHFTDFALVTSKSSSALTTVTTGVSTKTGLSYFKVSGKTVTPFTCKGTLRVATQKVNSTQLIAAGSSCTGTVKVYNTSGSLRKTLITGWSGVNSAAFADVTKDNSPDIILAPMLDKTVEVFDVLKSYKKINVVANGSNAKLTAKGIDFSGGGKANLVTAQVSAGAAKNFKVWKYASGAFTVTTSTYTVYIQNNNGSIALSIPKPTVTKFSTTSASHTSTAAKITLTGTNFTPDMVVTIGSVTAKVTYTSHTSVVITFNATTLTTGSSYALKLKNSGVTTVTTTTKVKIN